MTTTDDRPFMPGAPTPRLMRLYDPLSRVMGIRDAQWQLVAQAGIEPGATVVEIGCGTGNVLALAARVAPDTTVIGLDPDREALAIADRKMRRAGLAVRLDHGYADRLPYTDSSVDRVLSSLMFHHLPAAEQSAALREVRRVLVPGGRLHLLDLDGGRPTPPLIMRLLHRAYRSGAHQQGHGHGHGHEGAQVPVLDVLREAGFTDVAGSGHGSTRFGGHTFFRATR